MNTTQTKTSPNGTALIPFLVFIVVFLGSGLYFHAKGVDMAFYQLPSPVAILVAIALAFIMFKGTMDFKFSLFAKGCGNINIITMCCIYLFAGAFAEVAGAMGGVEATANFGLSIIPPRFIVAGLFLIASFLALSIGSAMATVGALAPVALEMSDKVGIEPALILAAIVCGAMFGDNLSMISDTTIAATRTQGCELGDKFKVNFLIALPAAVVAAVLFIIIGQTETAAVLNDLDYSLIKILPYILVLVLALAGLNVFLTLAVGIVSALIIGGVSGTFTLLSGAQTIYDGFTGMTEIFLLSMFTGGLAAMVTHYGGLDWLLAKIQGLIRGPKSAELGIAAIASAADLATANNTVAIIIAGPIAKEISDKYHVDPRKSASLLDIWACVFQGLIPYGAQILLACSIAAGAAAPLELLPYMWYPMLLAAFAILSIFIPYANWEIKRNPWNWNEGKSQKKLSNGDNA